MRVTFHKSFTTAQRRACPHSNQRCYSCIFNLDFFFLLWPGFLFFLFLSSLLCSIKLVFTFTKQYIENRPLTIRVSDLCQTSLPAGSINWYFFSLSVSVTSELLLYQTSFTMSLFVSSLSRENEFWGWGTDCRMQCREYSVPQKG